MTHHHPHHPEGERSEIDGWRAEDAERAEPRPEDSGMTLAVVAMVFGIVIVFAALMALRTSQFSIGQHRPQVSLVPSDPAPKLAEKAQDRPSLSLPIELPTLPEPAPVDLSDLRTSLLGEPAQEITQIASAANELVAKEAAKEISRVAPVIRRAVTRRRHAVRRVLRHVARDLAMAHRVFDDLDNTNTHSSSDCLTPRPDGREHDFASCAAMATARLGGLIP